MTLAYVSNAGTNTGGGGSTSSVCPVSAAFAVNNVAILMIAKDNEALTTGATNDCTGVTDTKGNFWQKLDEYTFSPGSITDDGITVAAFMSKISVALTTADTVTPTYASTSSNRMVSLEKFTSTGTPVKYGTSQRSTGTTGTLGSLTQSSLASAAYLALRVVGIEGAGGTTTVSSGYTAITGVSNATTDVRGERLISTNTSFTSAMTISNNRDTASIFVVISDDVIASTSNLAPFMGMF